MKHLSDEELYDILSSTEQHPHLDECESCTERFHAFTSFDRVLQKHVSKPVPQIDFTDAIMQRVNASQKTSDMFDYFLVGTIAALVGAFIYLFFGFIQEVDFSTQLEWLASVNAVLQEHKMLAQGVSVMVLLLLADWLIQLRNRRQKS